jgi:release factor glutamine methyltransferase
MALGSPPPDSFEDALKLAKTILTRSEKLVGQNLVDIEAELLVCAAYRKAGGESLSRTEFFNRIKDRFPEKAGNWLIINAAARAEGQLLQHLTGVQVFLDHEYSVNSSVLVPRPETEVLVRTAIETLAAKPPGLGFEIGLGSGVITIELLSKFPDLKMRATELSKEASQTAAQNAGKILKEGAARLRIIRVIDEFQVLEPFGAEKADFIISNPPYLDPANRHEVSAEVLLHEPEMALFAPLKDPLWFYRKISEQGPSFLNNRGLVFLEIPHERAEKIKKLFEAEASLWNSVKVIPDLTGRERVLVAARAGG